MSASHRFRTFRKRLSYNRPDVLQARMSFPTTSPDRVTFNVGRDRAFYTFFQDLAPPRKPRHTVKLVNFACAMVRHFPAPGSLVVSLLLRCDPLSS